MSRKALRWVAIAMGAYQLLYTQVLIQAPEGHLITHLGLALTVVILSLMAKAQTKARLNTLLILLICSLGSSVYFLVSLKEIMLFRSAIPNIWDLIMGVSVLALLLVVNWMVFGKSFSLITIIAIVFLMLGRYLPYPFTVADVSWIKLTQWLTVSFEGGLGVYGDILQLSAVYLFLFIFFGGVLSAFGGTRFIMGFGRWVGSKLSSGAAMVALIGSSLLGTITGSTVANITITGTFTIPMMKNGGYRPAQAGAIEAVSSNGGQITPPVMGATAFILAGFAGVPYIKVVKASIIPAAIYFFCVFCFIQLTAKKQKIKVSIEPVNGRQLLLDSPIFFVPMGLLVFLLIKGFSLPFVGFWSIMSIIGVGLLCSIRKEARLNFKQVVHEISQGAITASQIAMICALIGVIATCIKVSGLGVKLPLLIHSISGGHVLVALFIAMVSSILLGMGVPTAAAYMLVAIGAVPALIEMGVPLISAHLFCFIFAAFSHITPPVAIGALVASRMAEADYLETNWEALKAAFVAFLLPYLLIYVPAIVLKPEGGLVSVIMIIVGIMLMITASQISLVGYCFKPLGIIERYMFLVPSLFLAIYIFGRKDIFLGFGIACFTIALIWQYVTNKGKHIPSVAKIL